MQIKREMKSYAGKLLGVVAIALTLASCGSYNQLLKSENYDKMYEKALEYYAEKRYSRTITLLEEIAPYVSGSSKEDSVAYYFAADLSYDHFLYGDHDCDFLYKFRLDFCILRREQGGSCDSDARISSLCTGLCVGQLLYIS